MIWLFFLELASRVKHIFSYIFDLSFLNARFNVNTFMGILFALIFFYTLKVHSVSIENLAHAQGVLFSEGARALTPQELMIVYSLVGLSALLVAFFRGPLVFIGYFLAFISYIVFISF
jgi:hypothetical protein